MDFCSDLLVGLGFLIVLVIAFGLLSLIIGFFHTVLGVHLWNIEAETGFWSMLFHGLVFFIILLIVNLITYLLPNLTLLGTPTYVVTFVITTFLDGVIGKQVSLWFGREIKEKVEESKEKQNLNISYFKQITYIAW